MLGKKVNLACPPMAGGFYGVFEVDTDASMAGWSVRGRIYDPLDPTTAIESLNCSINATDKTITAYLTAADCDRLLNGGVADVDYAYVISCDPGGGVGYVRCFYGEFTVIAGGPDNVAATPSSSPSASPSAS